MAHYLSFNLFYVSCRNTFVHLTRNCNSDAKKIKRLQLYLTACVFRKLLLQRLDMMNALGNARHCCDVTVLEIGPFNAIFYPRLLCNITEGSAHEGYRLVTASVYTLYLLDTSRVNRLQNVWVKSTKKLDGCSQYADRKP